MGSLSLSTLGAICDSLFEENVKFDVTTAKRALVVDMSTCSSSVFDIPKLWLDSYMSGCGLAARLWAQFADDADNNPVVFASSAVSDGNVTSIAFRSPQSKRLFFNRTNGVFGSLMKKRGYSAVVIKGKSNKFQTVRIVSSGAVFTLAENIFGYTTEKTARAIGTEPQCCVCIGPAGENKVLQATCICGGVSTGRGGLGCVFGQKGIKALAVPDRNPVNDESFSLPYVAIANKRGWAPVENFSKRSDPRLAHLCESEFARIYAKNSIDESIPPFDAILMLGGNIGCFDVLKVRKIYNQCITLGLDPVAIGCIMASEKQYSDFFIKSIADHGYEGNVYSVNGMEAGPYDYRGNFAQALSDGYGNHFNLFFNANPQLCKNNYDYWTCLGEETAYGLECFGYNTCTLETKAMRTNRIVSFVLGKLPKLASKYFCLTQEAKVISAQLKMNVDSASVTDFGRRCMRLVFEINKALGFSAKIEIPEHFCIDPESNCETDAIVPMHNLVWNYMKRHADILGI